MKHGIAILALLANHNLVFRSFKKIPNTIFLTCYNIDLDAISWV